MANGNSEWNNTGEENAVPHRAPSFETTYPRETGHTELDEEADLWDRAFAGPTASSVVPPTTVNAEPDRTPNVNLGSTAGNPVEGIATPVPESPGLPGNQSQSDWGTPGTQPPLQPNAAPAYQPVPTYEPAAVQPGGWSAPPTGFSPPAAVQPGGWSAPPTGFSPPPTGAAPYSPPVVGAGVPASSQPQATGQPFGTAPFSPTGFGQPPMPNTWQDPNGAGVGSSALPSTGTMDLSSAMSWASTKYKESIGVMTIPGILGILGTLLLIVIAIVGVFPTLEDDSGLTTGDYGQMSGTTARTLFIFSTVSLIPLCVSALIVDRLALQSVQGQKLTVRSVWENSDFGRALIAGTVSSVLILLGLGLCIVPGVIAVFLFRLSTYVAWDTSSGIGKSLSASMHMAAGNVGSFSGATALILVLFVVSYVVSLVPIIGPLLFLVLTVLVYPFISLLRASLYQQVRNTV